MWLKDQNGRLINTDHLERISVQENKYSEAGSPFQVMGGWNLGDSVLASFATRDDAEKFLDSLHQRLSGGVIQ